MFKKYYYLIIINVIFITLVFFACTTSENTMTSEVSSLVKVSTNAFYETSADDGSFSDTIKIELLSGVNIADNYQSSGNVFGVSLNNRSADENIPITVESLPNGLSIQLNLVTNAEKVTINVLLQGNSVNHVGRENNTKFAMTLASDLFVGNTDNMNVSFEFNLNFIISRWSPRLSHQSFVHDDKVWVLGGTETGSDDSRLNDIWTSSDGGVNWQKVTTVGTIWSARSGHQAFAYNQKLWVVGGDNGNTRLNDIWTSSDGGVNWQQVTTVGTIWSARTTHQAFPYNEKLWVIGGLDNGTLNDVWTSSDEGINWQKVTPTGTKSAGTLWSERRGHQAFGYDNKIWVLGGENFLGIPSSDLMFFSSDGGASWIETTEADPIWIARFEHQAFVYDDMIWVLGGGFYTGFDPTRNSFEQAANDIWYSKDKSGGSWVGIGPMDSWSKRGFHQSFAYNNKLWVLGGFSPGGAKGLNDIWFSEDNGETWQEVSRY